MNEHGPKHPLLDSVTHRFQQNQIERQKKEDAFHVKRSVEKAHSEYIQKNLVTPLELSRASVPVAHFAKKHGLRSGSAVLDGSARQQRATTSSPNTRASNQSVSNSNLIPGRKPANVGNHSGEGMEITGDETSLVSAGRSMSTAIDVDLNDEVELMDIQEVIDVSNNCESSSTEFSCTVLNCDAKFSSDGSLGQHMNLFQHSPCNPCLKAKDCKLLPDPLCYVCPDCDCEFTQSEDCKAHMQSEVHSIFLPPLKISAYMCPQCLYLFENFENCWHHMEKSSHQTVCYPFIDDQGVGSTGPVAVPEELVEDLVRRCGEVVFSVQCLECSLIIETPHALRTHCLETNGTHVVSALTDTNLVDVFASYLSRYSCDVCHRLFKGSVTMLAGHQCAVGIMGKISDNDTTSFAQFVKRCALSFVKSLEPKNVPGPSYQSRQAAYSPDRNQRRKSGEGSGENTVKTASNVRKSSLIILDDSDDDEDIGASAGQAGNKGNKDPEIIHIESDIDSPVIVSSKRKHRSPDENDNRKVSKPKILVTSPNASETKIQSNKPETGKRLEKKNSGYLFLPMGQNSPTSSQRWCGSAVAGPSTQPQQIVPPPIPPLMDFQQRSTRQGPALAGPSVSPRIPPLMDVGWKTRQDPIQRDHRSRQYSGENRRQRERDNCSRDPRSNRLNVDRSRSRSRSPYSRSRSPRSRSRSPCSRSRSRSPMHTGAVAGTSSGGASTSGASSSGASGGVGLGANIVSKEHLSTMTQIIFLDLDNWPGFFSKLPRVLPRDTFVWGFYGGKNVWREPRSCWLFQEMKRRGQFYLHERCGRTKDAADVAIVMMVTMMHNTLPDHVAFTIVSGDQAFLEVQRQMRHETRTAIVINPHLAQKKSPDMIYVMVTSVTDT